MEINSTLTTIIGVVGATIVLIAFIMNQRGSWTNESKTYDFWNFIGSFLLVIYAILLSSIPFLILNLVWGGVSLKDLIVRKK